MRKHLPVLLALAGFFVSLWTIPVLWCRRGADAWFEGKQSTQEELAAAVAGQVERSLTHADFHTNSDLFNGEWLFGTHLMSGIGLCQFVQQHPDTLEKRRPIIEKCIDQLLSPLVRKFDRTAWHEDALDSLSGAQGHAAYLGYLNFLLSLYRQIDPDNRYAALNDAITAALFRRMSASPSGLVATYPNEWYPVDNCPGLASIAMQGAATGNDYSVFLSRQEELFRKHGVDQKTHLMIQATNRDGSPRDVPRGSGSTLGLFFLSRAFPKLGAEIFSGIQTHLATGLFRFGAIREFPRGVRGSGDIDSGPVIFGFGFSATGFAIGNARAYGDRELFARLYASAILAGAPIKKRGELDFLTAGPLGNAILFAMFTAPSVPP